LPRSYQRRACLGSGWTPRRPGRASSWASNVPARRSAAASRWCAIPALAGLTPDEAYAGAARFSTDAKKQKKQQQQNLAAHGVGLIAGIRSHPARL